MNKVKELRKKNGYSQEKLASILNVHQTAISQWETGRTSPDIAIAEQIADLFGVTIGYVLGKEEQGINIENIIPLKTKKIPLLGEIACGEPILAQEEYGDFVTASADLNVDFCLKAKGDSMIGARIYDGDLVFIRKQPSVNNGEIAAICIADEATLKRVYYYPDKNKLVLNPENPAYEPLVYIGKELEEVKILGKAIAFQSLVR